MPRLMVDGMEDATKLGKSNYGYSKTRVSNLGATEYTLATLILDKSSSLNGFDRDLEGVIKVAVEFLKKTERAQYLLLRILYFNQELEEIHGFRLISNIKDTNEYTDTLQSGGTTNLYDATANGVEAVVDYASELLNKKDIGSNGWVMVVTDGQQVGSSTYRPADVKRMIENAKSKELLESIVTILVGVNTHAQGITSYLQDFQRESGIDQYIDISDLSKDNLAKFGGLVYKSISSQSQALGSGGPSKPITLDDI